MGGRDAPLGGIAQHLALFSPAMSVMVGTDEIQRNVIGERLLGVPAEPESERADGGPATARPGRHG